MNAQRGGKKKTRAGVREHVLHLLKRMGCLLRWHYRGGERMQ